MPQPLTRGQRGYLLASLTLANVVNFYDRTIPAVIVEPLKEEFGLTDTMVGVLGGSFTVVYAIALGPVIQLALPHVLIPVRSVRGREPGAAR